MDSTLAFAISRLTAKEKERRWDSGFIWIHGQSDPVPINRSVHVRSIPGENCIECIVKEVNDPFDPGYEAHQGPGGKIIPAREPGQVNGWTYIALDAINRIDLFERLERKPESKIITPPTGLISV